MVYKDRAQQYVSRPPWLPPSRQFFFFFFLRKKEKKGPARADFFARHSEWMGCCLILSSFSHSLPIRVNDMWAPSRTHTPAHHAHLNRHTRTNTQTVRERERKRKNKKKRREEEEEEKNLCICLKTLTAAGFIHVQCIRHIVRYFSEGCLVYTQKILPVPPYIPETLDVCRSRWEIGWWKGERHFITFLLMDSLSLSLLGGIITDLRGAHFYLTPHTAPKIPKATDTYDRWEMI